jgi:uncharacterized protein YkvS
MVNISRNLLLFLQEQPCICIANVGSVKPIKCQDGVKGFAGKFFLFC